MSVTPQSIVDSVRALADDPGLAVDVATEGGFAVESVRCWLTDWAESITVSALEDLVQTATRLGPRLEPTTLVTLAPGNVPIVAAECLITGLLAGVEHRLALSSRAAAVAIGLLRQLEKRHSALNNWIELAVWRDLTQNEQDRWLTSSDRAVVYGRADTVEWVARRRSKRHLHGTIVPHGPSLALAIIDERETQIDETLSALTRDISIWDQRGCRSPHWLLAVGSERFGETVVQILASELGRVARETPTGQIPKADRYTRLFDLLTSRSLGPCRAGAGWILSLEREPRTLRPSPTSRVFRVIGVCNAAAVNRLIETLPAPLGIVATRNARPFSGLKQGEAQAVAIGTLQTPVFSRRHDGRHRLDELLSPLGPVASVVD